MAYLGYEPSKVAVTVGQGVIDATHIQDASITTADLGNDSVTPIKIDDDGTGFQMGSLGLGGAVSGSDKLTVTGDANFDSNTLFVDASESKVGVGLNNPAKVFHVEKSVGGDFLSRIKNTDATNGEGLQIHADNTNSGFRALDVRNSNGQIFQIYNDGAIVIKGDGSDQTTKWHTGSAYVNAKLDVRQLAIAFSGTDKVTSDTSGNFTFASDVNVTADGARFFVSSADYEVAMVGRAGSSGSALDQGYVRLKSSGTNTVALHSAGDSYINGGSLAVGTTSPSEIFHVQGTGVTDRFARFESTNFDMFLYVDADSGSSNNDADTGIIFRNNNSEKFRIGVDETDGGFHIATGSFGTASNKKLTVNSGGSVTFADQVNFGTTDSYIKQSRFGYSSSYHVLQLGEASSTRAISIGADVSGNNSGGFTGNEILIPNARGILAPNNANNAFLGVLAVTSSDTIEIGRGNHSIVNTSGNAISINTSNNRVSLSGGQSDYSTLGIHTVGTNTYSETGNTNHTNTAITIDFPNADQSFGAIRWRSHGNMEQFFGVVQQGSGGQGDWVWQGFDGSAYDERMRLSEEGLLSIKYGIDSYGLYINGLPSSSTKGILLACGSSSATVDAILFRDGSNDNCGNITLNSQANTTNYGASSDYRLKENEEIISDGIERIKKLKPYRFNFITAPDQTMDGFFAHELAEHIPEAVSGEKDAMDGDEIKPQNVDYGKVTPLLVKAVQELIAKVEALEGN